MRDLFFESELGSRGTRKGIQAAGHSTQRFLSRSRCSIRDRLYKDDRELGNEFVVFFYSYSGVGLNHEKNDALLNEARR